MKLQRIVASTLPTLIAAFIIFGTSAPSAAQSAQASAQDSIRAALETWTENFNARNAQKVCDLFSSELRYDYKGAPERNYRDICDLLDRSLTDATKRYAYSLAIKEIIVSGELAVVRLVWTLTIAKPDSREETVSREVGMDVFRKQSDDTWKIIRFIAYDE